MTQDLHSIGRYQVLSLLGQGAMGRVFLAQDPLLKRKVAVKVVQAKARDATDQAMERFQREAEISARLNHPNIITVHDVGVDPVAGPFLAMEYIEGASLARMIRERRVDPELGLKLLFQLAQALGAAQASGIVHRDVKPENMLISQDGRLKLMDFGIANQADQTRLTALGTVVGTPSYTAPELLTGGEPNPGTDRYAFAVTAFECFTGKVPFGGDTVGATLLKIVHEPPSIPPDMAPGLGRVFRKALSKTPGDRYPDLASILEALVEAAPLADASRARFRAALEGEGSLSGLGSGPKALHPSIDPEPDAQSTRKLRTSGAHVLPRIPDGEDPLAFLDRLESMAGIPEGTRPLPQRSSGDHANPQVPAAKTQVAAVPPAKGKGRLLWVGGAAIALGAGISAWMLLQSPSGPRMLRVETDPPGATVWVDGQTMARTTPVEGQIPSSATRLEVRLDGYESVQQDLPKDGGSLPRILLKARPLTLSLTTYPSGARVKVNDMPFGETPLKEKPLPVTLVSQRNAKTKLTLRVEKDGYIPQVFDYYLGTEVGTIELVPVSKKKR